MDVKSYAVGGDPRIVGSLRALATVASRIRHLRPAPVAGGRAHTALDKVNDG